MLARIEERTSDSEVGDLALRWLQGDDRALMIVGPYLEILWANECAEIKLQHGTEIKRSGQTLSTQSAGSTAKLLELIQRCRSGEATLCLAAERDDEHILVKANALTSDSFGLAFFGSGGASPRRYVGLREAFALTGAEERVLLLLAEGHRAAGIASLLRVSVSTTRSHIKSLYTKLKVHSREGLLSRIQGYRI